MGHSTYFHPSPKVDTLTKEGLWSGSREMRPSGLRMETFVDMVGPSRKDSNCPLSINQQFKKLHRAFPTNAEENIPKRRN